MVLGLAFYAGCFAVAHAASIMDETRVPPDVAAFLSDNPESTAPDPVLAEIKKDAVPALQKLAADSALIAALRANNDTRMTLTSQEIAARGRNWQKAVADRDWKTLESILGTPASNALRAALKNKKLADARIYVSDSRNLLTAASAPVQTFELGDWGGWKRIYMSSPHTAFIDMTGKDGASGFYRVEIGIRDPKSNEAIGTLIAEIPGNSPSQARANDATSSTSADQRN